MNASVSGFTSLIDITHSILVYFYNLIVFIFKVISCLFALGLVFVVLIAPIIKSIARVLNRIFLSIFQQNLAIRRKRKNLLKYKQILKSILGPQYLTEEGFLKTPEGKAESIQIKDNSPSLITKLLDGNPRTTGAYYKGGLHAKALRYNI